MQILSKTIIFLISEQKKNVTKKNKETQVSSHSNDSEKKQKTVISLIKSP